LRRLLLAALAALSVLALAGPAWAGSPHFVTASATVSGDTLTATFKEAGLGNEPQVHVVLTASAQCVNPGNQDPQAGNKQTFQAAGDFPVQSGKAEGSLSVTAVLQPSCSPPMTVRWSEITLTDTTSGISVSL
jgi:hypothetical protein